MRNNIILTLSFLLITSSGNAFSHPGTHTDSWLQTMLHFATSSDHLPFIVAMLITIGLAVFLRRKYFA